MGNGGGNIPGQVTRDATLEFAAYDRLPPRVKELFDSGPFALIPTEIEQLISMRGEEFTLLAMETFYRQKTPLWRGPLRKSKNKNKGKI